MDQFLGTLGRDKTPFPASGGQCADILRAIDWENHPLGDPSGWPTELMTVVRLALTSKFATMIHWGPELYTFYNDVYAARLGRKHPGHLGQPAKDWWSEMWDQLDPFFVQVLQGESFYTENARYTPDRDGTAKDAYFTHSHSPIWNAEGDVYGIFVVVVETTAQVDAEAQNSLLMDELAHRIKNIFATVQAVANLTLRNAPDLQGARTALSNRLNVMGRAQDMLIASKDDTSGVGALVELATGPYGGGTGQISTAGPLVEIGPAQSLALAMTLHELTTNALKYGALSTSEGHVAIAWSVTQGEEPTFEFTWTEIGGPQVSQPTSRGFGSSMIERSLGPTFKGTIDVTYPVHGLALKLTTAVGNLSRGH